MWRRDLALILSSPLRLLHTSRRNTGALAGKAFTVYLTRNFDRKSEELAGLSLGVIPVLEDGSVRGIGVGGRLRLY